MSTQFCQPKWLVSCICGLVILHAENVGDLRIKRTAQRATCCGHHHGHQLPCLQLEWIMPSNYSELTSETLNLFLHTSQYFSDVGITPLLDRTTQTHNEIRTHIHTLSWIWTNDTRVRAGVDGTCGHCDRRLISSGTVIRLAILGS
jgi:hypothetical protein